MRRLSISGPGQLDLGSLPDSGQVLHLLLTGRLDAGPIMDEAQQGSTLTELRRLLAAALPVLAEQGVGLAVCRSGYEPARLDIPGHPDVLGVADSLCRTYRRYTATPAHRSRHAFVFHWAGRPRLVLPSAEGGWATPPYSGAYPTLGPAVEALMSAAGGSTAGPVTVHQVGAALAGGVYLEVADGGL